MVESDETATAATATRQYLSTCSVVGGRSPIGDHLRSMSAARLLASKICMRPQASFTNNLQL